MEKRKNSRKRMTEITVNVDFKGLENSEKRPPAKAYLFSSSGQLLDSKILDETGKAIFMTDYGFGKTGRFRVAIGPETEQVSRLQDSRARTQIIHAELGSKVKIPFEVVKPDWICWWPKFNYIMGDVKKKIVADADTTFYAPICNALVEVYEVDFLKFVIALPDSVIEDIRKKIIKKFQIVWPPKIFPPPPPPPPLEGMPEFLERSASGDTSSRFAVSETNLNAFSSDLTSGVNYAEIQSAPTTKLRQLFIDKAILFKPLLCLWFPNLFLTVSSLGTVSTDATGHFSMLKAFFCQTDEPDLYFVVRQVIGGTLKNIYSPRPISCYTYWNYKSGTNVTLIVTDPAAIACFDSPPPDKLGMYVMPLGIGNDGWYNVDQAHIKPPNVAGAMCGLYRALPPPPMLPPDGKDPYGTILDIQMQFHDGLRSNGVLYYRWSYRKATTDWTNISRPITHRHLELIAGKPALVAENLGPKTEKQLFLVPDHNKDWVVISREDRAFAIWDTSGLPNGKYQLRLEMFDTNGNKITNPSAKGFKFFLPTAAVTAGIWPVDDSLHVEPDGSIILNLHIDNSDTVADIKSIALGGTPAGECQFLEYLNKAKDKVVVTYVAFHPNGFLDRYDLVVKRGISGYVVPEPPPHSFSTPASTPTAMSYDVQHLLENFEQCAFTVWIKTWPRTRDGYTRIRKYESDDSSAFALMNKSQQPQNP